MHKHTPYPRYTRREFIRKSALGTAGTMMGLSGFPAIAFAKKTLTVGYIPILDHLTLPISHYRDNGGFRHISITPRLFKSWSSISGALRAGVIDAAFLLSPHAMALFSRGVEIKSVLVGHRNGSAITVREGAGITRPKDLRGRKIGIPSRDSTHAALLDRYLRQDELTLADVVPKVIAPPHMLLAMKANRIDAFIVAEPFSTRAERMGIGKTLLLSKEIIPEHICCVAVVRRKAIEANPEGIREWVESLQKSGKAIDQDKADNRGMIVAEIAEKYTPHKAADIARGMLNPEDRITYNRLAPKVSDYREVLDLARRAGLIKDMKIENFIDDRFALAST